MLQGPSDLGSKLQQEEGAATSSSEKEAEQQQQQQQQLVSASLRQKLTMTGLPMSRLLPCCLTEAIAWREISFSASY